MREARVYVQQRERVRALLVIKFGNDLSFYLMPPTKLNQYYWGEQTLNEDERDKTFHFHEQLAGTKAPQISFHESGRVHVKLGRNIAGPLQIPRLTDLRGHHVASVMLDSITNAPMHVNELKNTSSIHNYRIPIGQEVTGLRLVVRVGQESRTFSSDTSCVLQIKDTSRHHHLLIGLAAVPQHTISEQKDSRGIVAIGGWDPMLDKLARQRIFYVRGV
jgi:hypothetical protein